MKCRASKIRRNKFISINRVKILSNSFTILHKNVHLTNKIVFALNPKTTSTSVNYAEKNFLVKLFVALYPTVPSPIALQSQTMSMMPGYFHWKQKETRAKRPLIPRCSDPQILILHLSSGLKFLQLPWMTNYSVYKESNSLLNCTIKIILVCWSFWQTENFYCLFQGLKRKRGSKPPKPKEPSDPSQMTMQHLIYFNPKTNPMR